MRLCAVHHRQQLLLLDAHLPHVRGKRKLC
jgi:hypothetical protein